MANMNMQNGHRNNSFNEKSDNGYYPPQGPPPQSSTPQPPPAYASPPPQANWPPLAQATALYAYSSADAGDLALQPNDHITVTEYMNAEWWKGKSTRTGQEGIFPRSYVKVIDEKAPVHNTTNNYGNAPLEVSGMGNGEGKTPSKVEEGEFIGVPFLGFRADNVTQVVRSLVRNWAMLQFSALALRLVATLSIPSSRLTIESAKASSSRCWRNWLHWDGVHRVCIDLTKESFDNERPFPRDVCT